MEIDARESKEDFEDETFMRAVRTDAWSARVFHAGVKLGRCQVNDALAPQTKWMDTHINKLKSLINHLENFLYSLGFERVEDLGDGIIRTKSDEEFAARIHAQNSKCLLHKWVENAK